MSYGSKVSILIPAYNHEDYIEKLLDSVAADSYKNKEMLIIDDGSVDGTRDRIEAWLSRRAGVIEARFLTRENRGLSSTLNELVDMATGDYVAIIASDDYLLGDSVRCRAIFLDENRSCKAVFGDCVVVDAAGQILFESGLEGLYGVNKRLYHSRSSLKRQIISHWSVPGGTLMVRKEVFESIRFDERFMMEDRAFYLRLVAKGWLAFLDAPLAAYRLHGGNVSRTKGNRYRMSKDSLLILWDSLKYFGFRDRLYFLIPIIRNAVLLGVRGGWCIVADRLR